MRLKSKDPRQHPSILFNYMACDQDWQEFRDAIRITREIMPQIITGNLNATTIMLAEKLADVIRGRPSLAAANVPYFVAGDRPVRQQI